MLRFPLCVYNIGIHCRRGRVGQYMCFAFLIVYIFHGGFISVCIHGVVSAQRGALFSFRAFGVVCFRAFPVGLSGLVGSVGASLRWDFSGVRVVEIKHYVHLYLIKDNIIHHLCSFPGFSGASDDLVLLITLWITCG